MPYSLRPPSFVARLEDGDVMAEHGEPVGAGEAGRAAADHGDALARGRAPRLKGCLPAAISVSVA